MEKQYVRTELLEERKALSPETVQEASHAIYEKLILLPQIERAETVLVYADFANEVATAEFTGWLLYHHKKVALPVVEDGTMQAVQYRGLELSPNRYGIAQPFYSQNTVVSPESIDVIVCPGVGFTRNRDRLGFGKGFYDRYFQRAPRAFRVGLAYGFQIVDCFDADVHDVKMDVVVTPDYILG